MAPAMCLFAFILSCEEEIDRIEAVEGELLSASCFAIMRYGVIFDAVV